MKKLSILAILLTVIAAGCSKNEEKTVYTAGIYPVGESSESGDALNNALYKFVTAGVEDLNKKYSKQEVAEVDDEKACADFSNAVADLENLKKDFDDKLASGTDFGTGNFNVNYQYKVMREITEIKTSKVYNFSYKRNTRIEAEESVEINTTGLESESGSKSIMIYDFDQTVTVKGYKLYNQDGTPSNATLITGVTPFTNGGKSYLKIAYSAENGKDAGEFYLLVTFSDTGDLFDYKITVKHITD